MARFGIIDYDSDSVLSITRAYYQYLTFNHHLTNEDEIILHNTRCLTRLCNSSSDVDIESYLNKLYRLFLYVSKFLRNWHLPPIGGNLDPYANRIMFILKIGIEYEKKANFGGNVEVFTESDKLIATLNKRCYNDTNLLIMTSGNFSGVDLKAFAQEISNK